MRLDVIIYIYCARPKDFPLEPGKLRKIMFRECQRVMRTPHPLRILAKKESASTRFAGLGGPMREPLPRVGELRVGAFSLLKF